MARVKLLENYRTFKEGTSIEVPSGEASRLIQQRIAILDRSDPTGAMLELRCLDLLINTFTAGLANLAITPGSEEEEEANLKLRTLVETLSEPACATSESEEVSPAARRAYLIGVLPKLNLELHEILEDEEIEPCEKEPLILAISEFVASFDVNGAVDATSVIETGSGEEAPEETIKEDLPQAPPTAPKTRAKRGTGKKAQAAAAKKAATAKASA